MHTQYYIILLLRDCSLPKTVTRLARGSSQSSISSLTILLLHATVHANALSGRPALDSFSFGAYNTAESTLARMLP